MYKSLFSISIPAGDFISFAVTFPFLFLESFNHSVPTDSFFNTNPFKLRIISIILSLIQGRVEYSWFTPFTFIQVILVPGIEESNILLNEFPKVTQYHLGNGHTVKDAELISKSFCIILGTQIVLCIICILLN